MNIPGFSASLNASVLPAKRLMETIMNIIINAVWNMVHTLWNVMTVGEMAGLVVKSPLMITYFAKTSEKATKPKKPFTLVMLLPHPFTQQGLTLLTPAANAENNGKCHQIGRTLLAQFACHLAVMLMMIQKDHGVSLMKAAQGLKILAWIGITVHLKQQPLLILVQAWTSLISCVLKTHRH